MDSIVTLTKYLNFSISRVWQAQLESDGVKPQECLGLE